MRISHSVPVLICLFLLAFLSSNAQPRILTNQVGYEASLAKRAVVMAPARQEISIFRLIDTHTGQSVYQGSAVYNGPVSKWNSGEFWTLDFSRAEFLWQMSIWNTSTFPWGTVSLSRKIYWNACALSQEWNPRRKPASFL